MTTKNFFNHRVLWLLILLLTLFNLSAWGADYSKNESWNFTTSGNANWSSSNCGSYCGAWGKNKDASPSVYKTDISNFSAVNFSSYENVSLTIYVTSCSNGGTNSYTVKLIDSDGNQVSTYAITKTGGMGSGSSTSNASESSVTFSPTQAFSGYRIDFYPKSFITQTRYVLTYDNKAASDPYNVKFNTGTGNPSQSDIEETTGGAGITLPNITPACSSSGWALYGWATSACSSETSTAPTIVGKPGEKYYPASNNVTLYAVYAKGEYTKITTIGDLAVDTKYLIVANSTNNYILKSSSDDYNTTNHTMAGEQVDETTTGKYHAKDIDPNWRYTITGSTDNYRIRDVVNATNNYLDIAYTDWWGKAYDGDDPYKITVSAGVWSINCHYYYNSKYYDAYLGLDGSNEVFKSYSTTQSILLYKETTTPSYYSSPVCASCDYDPTITAASNNGSILLCITPNQTIETESREYRIETTSRLLRVIHVSSHTLYILCIYPVILEYVT